MSLTTYGDISPAVAASAAVEMLKRGQPHLVIQQFGQAKPLGKNQTTTQKFRRYERLAAATTPITEGVTPTGSSPTTTDYTATLAQYGDFLELTDVIADLHTDPVLQEYSGMIGEQAALTVEMIAFGIIKAGSVVYRANGAQRTDINTPLTLSLQRKAVRGFKRQLARPFTKKISSSANFNTESVLPSFIGLIHPDLESTVRGLQGFKDVVDYGSTTPYESEIGSVENVRYITSTVFEAWADGGGAKAGSGTTMISTSATSADVYPVIYLAPDAFGVVPLKGGAAITPMVMNPNTPRGGDPLGQRGSVAWKTYFTAVILNNSWMARVECSAAEL
jgi:N4-gp56 family major capsid protein